MHILITLFTDYAPVYGSALVVAIAFYLLIRFERNKKLEQRYEPGKGIKIDFHHEKKYSAKQLLQYAEHFFPRKKYSHIFDSDRSYEYLRYVRVISCDKDSECGGFLNTQGSLYDYELEFFFSPP